MNLPQKCFAIFFLALFVCGTEGKPVSGSDKSKKVVPQRYKELSIKCIDTDGKWKMEVRAYIMRLSEIIRNISCQDQPVQYLEIYVDRGIYIDTDLIKVGEAMQVVIIAPSWEIVGNRTINLNGTHGEVYKEPKAKIRHVSQSNKTLVKDGPNGKPGQPGGPAGSFYGIGNQVVNGQNLLITAHGGDGSAGQDGYDGVHGEKGITFYLNLTRIDSATGILGIPWDNDVYDPDGTKYKYIFEYHELDEDPNYVKKINYTKPLQYIIHNGFQYPCHVYGLPGTSGGNGGQGGVGGKGGMEGEIKLIYLRQDGSINWSAQDGKDGKDGIGGKKGIGGSNGDMVEFDCHDIKVSKPKNKAMWNTVPSKIKQEDGKDGQTGVNLIGQKRLKVAHIMYDFSHTINNYKTYARYGLKGSSRYNQLWNFMKLINDNDDIARNYTILGLVDEFTDLELQFHELKDYLELGGYYKSLDKKLRIINTNQKMDEEHETILIELSKRVETVIENIAEGDDYNLVPNVKKFGKELEKHDKYLTDLHSVNEMRQVFKNYKREIDVQLENAQEEIETVIQSKIENLMDELDIEVDQLISQITELEKKAETNKAKLEEQRMNLQSVMQKRALCGILKFIAGGLGKIHPIAGAGAAVVDGVISTYEESLDENVVMASVIPKAIVKNLQAVEAQLQLNKEAGTKKMENHLEEIKELIKIEDSDNKVALKEVEQAIETAISEASTSSTSSETEKTSEEIEIEKLKAAEESLKSKGLNRDSKYKRTFEVIKNLTQVISLTETLGEYRAKYIKDLTNVDNVEKLIDEESKGIKKLKKLEENVYTIMVPMLNNMRESIGISNNKLRSKSIIDLKIVKWQMDSKLSTLLKEIDEFKKGFPVEKAFEITIEELKKAINILIEIYGQMKKYSEKNNDAKFIFNLVKASKESGLHIVSSTDNKLREALSKMEEAHQLNFAISKYNRILLAFQQYTFPKSAEVLKTMSHISYSSIGKNLKNVETLIIANTKKIMENIGPSTGHKFLADRLETHFDRKNSSQPFHVWTNKKYADAIGHLLKGDEVMLFANISEHADLNGVRFNKVGLRFSSENPDLQRELDNVMEQFSFQLIHQGDSHYRCDKSIFIAKNSPTKMIYSLRKHEGDQLQETISSFTKNIWAGEFLLSPYATWKIEIKDKQNYTPRIEVLQKFINRVDLELVGRGVYTNIDRKQVCEHLKRFYTEKKSLNKKRLITLL